MANRLFRDITLNKVRSAIREAKDVSVINHSYLKGKIREIVLDNFLTPYLTSELSCGSGKVMDYIGNQSSEIDIVIYSKKILPSIMFDIKTGVFPIESCFQIIEVKSKTSSEEIKDAIKKGESIKQLRFLNGHFHNDQPCYASGSQLHRTLFAFDSDLKDTEEIIRYAELDENFATDPAFTSICVVGKCFHYFDANIKKWAILHPPSEEYDQEHYEVIYFLTLLVNSLPHYLKNRGIIPFGMYLNQNDEGIRLANK
jgi:hypothetical protein